MPKKYSGVFIPRLSNSGKATGPMCYYWAFGRCEIDTTVIAND